MNRPIELIKLASGPGEVGLVCDKRGVTLAGYPLLAVDWDGLSPRPATEIQDILEAVYGADSGLAVDDLMRGLASVARSLNKGDLPLAMISSLLLRLPEVPNSRTLSKALPNRMAKAGYNEAEPRDQRGRWADGPGGGALQALGARLSKSDHRSAAGVRRSFPRRSIRWLHRSHSTFPGGKGENAAVPFKDPRRQASENGILCQDYEASLTAKQRRVRLLR